MPSGILGTALTGLMAFQRAMQTNSNNVANVNTPGYNRQNTNLTDAASTFTDGHYLGNGVDVTNVTRSYDQFISNNVRTSASTLGEANQYQTMTAQVDNLVSGSNTSLSTAISSFFKAVNGVSTDPTSIPARQTLLSQAGTMSAQFNSVSSQLENLREQNNGYMQTNVNDINNYAQNIADLNVKIATATQVGGTQIPNDLLDQRDQLLAKLSANVNVSTFTHADGAIDVFVGQGQALISGDSVSKLSLANSTTDSNQKDVMMNGISVTSQFTSGSLAGSLKFRDQVLDPAQKQLGLVAVGLGTSVNNVQSQGQDLNGATGTNMFSFSPNEIPVYASNGNQGGGIGASFDNSTLNQLQASDYRLDYNAGSYSLTRLNDNTKIMLPSGGLPATVDGITLTETSAPTGAASFIIRPTYQAATNISVNITDPKEIAASTSAADGDNTNALAMANLSTQSLLTGNNTINQAYQNMIGQVGTAASAANVSLSAQTALNTQAVSAQANFSGVNLDEEAANLIQLQNAYQASSQVVSIARTLFTSLLTAVNA